MTIGHPVMFHSFSSRPMLDLQLAPLALARDACLLEFEWMRSHPFASITHAFIAVIVLGRSRSSNFNVLMLYFDINQGQGFADSSWPCTW